MHRRVKRSAERSSHDERSTPERRVEVQPALVEALALADREHRQLVAVVRDQDDARVQRPAVDGQPRRVALCGDDRQRTQPRERIAPPPMVLAAMHEPRIDPERDVVQEEPVAGAPDVDPAFAAVDEGGERSDRIVAVEADVAGEMVAGAERDADERQVALDRDVGDRRERAVAARHAERIGGGLACERRRGRHRLAGCASRCRASAQQRAARPRRRRRIAD